MRRAADPRPAQYTIPREREACSVAVHGTTPLSRSHESNRLSPSSLSTPARETIGAGACVLWGTCGTLRHRAVLVVVLFGMCAGAEHYRTSVGCVLSPHTPRSSGLPRRDQRCLASSHQSAPEGTLRVRARVCLTDALVGVSDACWQAFGAGSALVRSTVLTPSASAKARSLAVSAITPPLPSICLSTAESTVCLRTRGRVNGGMWCAACCTACACCVLHGMLHVPAESTACE